MTEFVSSKGGHAIIQRKVDSGGKRKGAGRPKGSKNKERAAIESSILAWIRIEDVARIRHQ